MACVTRDRAVTRSPVTPKRHVAVISKNRAATANQSPWILNFIIIPALYYAIRSAGEERGGGTESDESTVRIFCCCGWYRHRIDCVIPRLEFSTLLISCHGEDNRRLSNIFALFSIRENWNENWSPSSIILDDASYFSFPARNTADRCNFFTRAFSLFLSIRRRFSIPSSIRTVRIILHVNPRFAWPESRAAALDHLSHFGSFHNFNGS